MQRKGIGWKQNARILWAITAKDLLEAIKNKNALAIIISALFVVVMYHFLPMLSPDNGPGLSIYDAGSAVGAPSELVQVLKESGQLEVTLLKSEERAMEYAMEDENPYLALVLPAGLDQAIQAGEPLHLQGYLMYWVPEESAKELVSQAEQEFSRLSGVVVTINTQGNQLYPREDSSFLGMQTALGTVFALIMVGLLVVPHLMIEEKQTRTIEALLISPASAGQIVAAKAITGLVYCLFMGMVSLLINQQVILHWGLALLALVSGAIFSISLGLLLGLKVESRAQLSMISWFLILPLFMPMIIFLLSELFPNWVQTVVSLIPTASVMSVLRASFAQPYDLGRAIFNLTWVAGWGVIILTVDAWLVRRMDRAPAGGLALVPGVLAETGNSFPLFDALGGLFSGRKAQVDAKVPAPEFSQQSGIPADEVEVLGSYSTTQTRSIEELRAAVRKPSWLQTVWTITRKDLREARKNRLVFTILLGSLLMVLMQAGLPLLLRRDAKPLVVVYDSGHSSLINQLAEKPDFYLRQAESLADMQNIVSGYPYEVLGLVVPENFDQRITNGENVVLQGYGSHWSKKAEIISLAEYYTNQFAQIGSGQVLIQTQGNIAYPSSTGSSQFATTSLLFISAISVIGLAIVPLLIVEEKENHTLEAMLVSPVSRNQILLGKVLAGLFYCAVSALVLLLVNHNYFVSWGVVLLTVVLTSLFAVSIGTLVGVIADNPTNSSLIASMLLLPMLGFAFLKIFSQPGWPTWLLRLLDWLPVVSVFNLLQVSMIRSPVWGIVASNAIILIASILLLFLLASSLMRKKVF